MNKKIVLFSVILSSAFFGCTNSKTSSDPLAVKIENSVGCILDDTKKIEDLMKDWIKNIYPYERKAVALNWLTHIAYPERSNSAANGKFQSWLGAVCATMSKEKEAYNHSSSVKPTYFVQIEDLKFSNLTQTLSLKLFVFKNVTGDIADSVLGEVASKTGVPGYDDFQNVFDNAISKIHTF